MLVDKEEDKMLPVEKTVWAKIQKKNVESLGSSEHKHIVLAEQG